MCEGWQTRDLAAHLWAREHRPDAGPGLVAGGALGRHTDKVVSKVAARPYDEIVGDLRDGPPVYWPGRWVPSMDVHEWFVHHEDVRRANDGARRDLGAFDADIWKAVDRWGSMLTKGGGVGIRAVTPDGRVQQLRDGDAMAVLHGEPGEILLHLFGRPAEVTVDGDEEAVARLDAAELGI